MNKNDFLVFTGTRAAESRDCICIASHSSRGIYSYGDKQDTIEGNSRKTFPLSSSAL
ncbi:hypothetical protein X777_01054 [Ooceraea biroi]|uniref:Uncharacterized protein n=1 Tax=Ooceraea biroi TaxID=2015173 RepID=A0A026WRX1_OOCBI|nr:hypothetical protein X777_01054 [Ooceraea biroi]